MHTEFRAFTITAADAASALGKVKRWIETRGATASIVSVTFTGERDDSDVTAVVVHTHSDTSGIQAIPVDGAPESPVDITDLLPAIREIAAEHFERGETVRRDQLLGALRARGLSVGGRRRKAVDDAAKRAWAEVKTARVPGSTGQ